MTAQPWLDPVIELIQQEIALSTEITSMLNQEQEALLHRDAPLLAQHNQQKNTLLIALDNKHSQLLDIISQELSLAKESLIADQWLQGITDQRKNEVSRLWHDLHKQLQTLKLKNQQNGLSLNRMVSRSRFLLRLLTGQTQASTYDAHGMESNSRQGSLGKA